MKPSSSKPMTPRSIINQKKALESRGTIRARTPGGDENKRPATTPSTPTSHFAWKGHTSRRDGVTPLGISGKLNRRAGGGTPLTPTRQTPSKSQHTPTRSDKTVLFEFEENLLFTPCSTEGGSVSISHTATVQVEPTPVKGSGVFNRSRSASSLLRSRKGGSGVKMRRSMSEARLPSDSSQSNPTSEDGELSRITVGVRVRPLLAREYGNIVTVEGNELKLASELNSVHSFTLDHIFNPSASQEEVYNTMVKPLLDSAFQGYNACLFAYGQTGSGKTYSMMGDETEVNSITNHTGIIPRFCEELIERVSNVNNDTGGDSIHTSTTVEVSYLEVYNEKIRDLLVPPPTQNIRVREHPVYGPYPADLSKHSVNTLSDIQHWISEGNKQRAIAATEMNEKSSRSHSLFMVILTQSVIQNDEGEGWTHENTRRSQINLVDLAGSERIAHSSVSSDRLREGVSINRSLMTLGKVISALVDKRSFVPYRESVLTWLLKESLGGNSRTAMLATVSPCSTHLDETTATLRYATQARSILNTVRVNETPQNKIIRELRAEIERLKVYAENDRSRTPSRLTSPCEDKSIEEVHRFKNKMDAMDELIEELNAKLKASEKAKNESEEREARTNEEARTQNERNSIEINKVKNEYAELRDKFKEFTEEHEKCLALCSEKDLAVESFKRRAQSAHNDRRVLLDKLDNSEKEVKRLSEAVEELLQQKCAWSEKLKNMEQSVQEWKFDLESRKKEEEEMKSKAEEAEREVELLRDRVTAYEIEAVERLNRTDTLEMQVEIWKSKINEIKTESEITVRSLEEEKTQKEYWKNEFEKCNNRLQSASDRVTSVEQELATCRASLEATKNEAQERLRLHEELKQRFTETSNELEKAAETLKALSLQNEVGNNDKVSESIQKSSRDTVTPFSEEMLFSIIRDSANGQKLQECENEYVSVKHVVELLGKIEKEKNESKDKIEKLENIILKQEAILEDMTSELELLRELETKYKNKLDQSLQDNEEAWSKKYNSVCEKLSVAENESVKLEKQLKESLDIIGDLNEQLNRSNLKVQSLISESPKTNQEVATLKRKCNDLQLKLDQKKKLILELEKVGSRSKEEIALTQTYATELKKQYDLLECTLKESKKINELNNARIDELETQVKMLQDELDKTLRNASYAESKLAESTEKKIDLEKTLKERDQLLVELHNQLASVQKMLQEQMTIKFEALKTMQEEESRKKDELDNKDVLAVENIRLKAELESTNEQLCRKKERLEKMKSNIDKLEDLLITTVRLSSERKNFLLIQKEHAKVFDCLMEHSYLFHWEYLLRKARSYAHKYHIPYEFERHDESTVIVKHLLYNAKSYWFRIDFKFWFENIEKNDRWNRELDEKLPWEVDFGNYYNIPNEKPGALCPLDESVCEDIETLCCKPGLICPSVWKRTIVSRHLNGLQDDARCLLIYFKSSKNQDIKDQLQIINNMAEQIRDSLSMKT